MSFQSYAKDCDTLTEVHSYLRDVSEKGGLGLDTQTNSSTTLNKSAERMTFIRGQQGGSQTTYSIGQKAKVADKGCCDQTFEGKTSPQENCGEGC